MVNNDFRAELPHSIQLEERHRLAVTGVSEVVSFDETAVHMETVQGSLMVHGNGLRLKNLNPEGSQLELTGTVEALVYEQPRRKGGFFGRVLG